ncbi:MAG: hypothetical protein WC498_01290 [Candidatus Saccharimonadales bacterium]
MKIFVSGQIADVENVRQVQQRFIDAGHTITHDWTRNEADDRMLSDDADKLKDMVETSRRARLDIQGVVDCDVYVICTDNEISGKGMYVELGAALALCTTNGSPRIYLIGKMNHMSVFYFHPLVTRVGNVEEAIELLDKPL